MNRNSLAREVLNLLMYSDFGGTDYIHLCSMCEELGLDHKLPLRELTKRLEEIVSEEEDPMLAALAKLKMPRHQP